MASNADVAVVGAGPTGLLLAGDLARAGVRCAVLERRMHESNLSRAFVLHARTLEVLDMRGLADQVIEAGQRLSSLRVFGRLDVDMSRLPSRFPFVLVLPQYRLERILESWARAQGAEIVAGAEVTGLGQDAAGVELAGRDGEGRERRWRASYGVGTDGVHSTVRSALGVPFPGRSAVRSVMLADVRLDDRPPDAITVEAARDGFAFVAPLGDGWHRVIAWDRRRQAPDSEPAQLDEIREVTRRVFGTDFGMGDARWISRFHSDERLVPRYRVGRVFLAGDAAHVDPPAGAQGMNTGLQDAANLGWKLAAAVQGWGSEWLLDAYEAERRPVAAGVRGLTDLLLRLALAHSTPMRAARSAITLAVGRSTRLNDRAARRLSGVDIACPRRGGDRRQGSRAADVGLATPEGGPTRLFEALRRGKFVLVAPPGGAGALELDRAWADRVDVAQAADPALPSTLVRPDGYVAWAGDAPETNRGDATLLAALRRWCGDATTMEADRR